MWSETFQKDYSLKDISTLEEALRLEYYALRDLRHDMDRMRDFDAEYLNLLMQKAGSIEHFRELLQQPRQEWRFPETLPGTTAHVQHYLIFRGIRNSEVRRTANGFFWANILTPKSYEEAVRWVGRFPKIFRTNFGVPYLRRVDWWINAPNGRKNYVPYVIFEADENAIEKYLDEDERLADYTCLYVKGDQQYVKTFYKMKAGITLHKGSGIFMRNQPDKTLLQIKQH